MIYKSGTVLFAGGLDDLDEAKKYIKRYNLSKDDVSLIQGKTNQSITVKVKDGREVELNRNTDTTKMQASGS